MNELTIVLKVSLEPREDRLETEHALPRSVPAAEVVRPVREADELDLASEEPRWRDELVSLLDGTTMILVRVEQEHWRDVPGERHREDHEPIPG